MIRTHDLWWKAPSGEAHKSTIEVVRKIEAQQSDVFDRLFKLEVLYDPNTPDADSSGENLAHVTENAIAANVDTIAAQIATVQLRPRFLTDGGDWQQQRTAKHLEWYMEEQVKTFGVLARCREAFKEAAKKGNGLVKVGVRFGAPYVEHVFVENVIVDQQETRDGRRPRHLHQYETVDADELAALHPEAAEQIDHARGQRRNRRTTTRQGSLQTNDVEVLHSWRLPVGVRGKDGYQAGRYVKAIDGCDLADDEYHDPWFPFAIFIWQTRAKSWYGISGAERIAGIQRALNKRNWQIERVLDQNANLTTYVRPADANLTVKTSRAGNIGVIKGDWPVTPNPPLVSAETYQSRLDLRAAAQQEFGQTQMATHGAKPAGLDSAVALREFKDQSSSRYATQEQDYEILVRDVVMLLVAVCKRLGDSAPVYQRRSRFGTRKFRWKDVDLRDAAVQVEMAPTLNRLPAGRAQSVAEFAQAGIISSDAAVRLSGFPDVERETSLHTSALEDVEACLDMIADGERIMPEPIQDLSMIEWRGVREYLQWRHDGAPEEILEALRTFISQAVYMKKMASPTPPDVPQLGADVSSVAAGVPPTAPTSPPIPGDLAGMMPGV